MKDAKRSGIYNPAYIVHHKEYVTDKNYEDDNVFFNIDNTESLCQDCHNKEHFTEEAEYCFDENGDLIKTNNKTGNSPPTKLLKSTLWENGGWAFKKSELSIYKGVVKEV